LGERFQAVSLIVDKKRAQKPRVGGGGTVTHKGNPRAGIKMGGEKKSNKLAFRGFSKTKQQDRKGGKREAHNRKEGKTHVNHKIQNDQCLTQKWRKKTKCSQKMDKHNFSQRCEPGHGGGRCLFIIIRNSMATVLGGGQFYSTTVKLAEGLLEKKTHESQGGGSGKHPHSV